MDIIGCDGSSISDGRNKKNKTSAWNATWINSKDNEGCVFSLEKP